MPTVPLSQGPRADLSGGVNATFTTPQVQVNDMQIGAPTLNTPQVSGQRIDTPQFRNASVDPSAIKHVELSDRGARQEIAAGQNLTEAGSAIDQAVLQYRHEVNATVVDDALDQARQQAMKLQLGNMDPQTGQLTGGYMNLKGEDAIRRPGGQSLAQEVGSQYDDAVRQIVAAKLTNQDQQRLFHLQQSDIRDNVVRGAMAHQADQFNTYKDGVYTAGLKNETASFGSPTLLPDAAGQAKALDRIDGIVGTLAVQKGASAEEYHLALRTARTNAVETLFNTALGQQNFTGAKALLNTYGAKSSPQDSGPYLDPDSVAKMNALVQGHVGAQLGVQRAGQIWQEGAAPAFQAGDATRGHNIVLALESHNSQTNGDGTVQWSHGKNGKPIAGGIGQLKPDTALAAAKTVPHPGMTDQQYADQAFTAGPAGEAANRALSAAHWGQLVTQFGGDQEKAAAAYNAGSGYLVGGRRDDGTKIEGALKWAARTGGRWQDDPELPAETKAYIQNFNTAYEAGDGKPAQPKLSDLLDKVYKDPALMGNKDATEAAITELRGRYSAAEEDDKHTKEDAYARSVAVLTAAGGNFNALPPELRSQVDPAKLPELLAYGEKLQSGGYNSTQGADYYQALAQARDPKATPAQIQAWQTKLAPKDFDFIRTEYTNRQAPQPGHTAKDLDTSMLDGIIENNLAQRGINIHPKAGDQAGQAYIGGIKSFLHQWALDRQAQTKQKITDYGDMKTLVDQAFLNNQHFKTVWLGGLTTDGGSINVMTAKPTDLDGTTRSMLKSQLRNGVKGKDGQLRGGLGRDPTDEELMAAYRRSQFYR